MRVGEGHTVHEFSVPANGEREIDIEIIVDLMRAMTGLQSWYDSGQRDLDLRVIGFVDTGGAGLGRIDIDESAVISGKGIFY